MSNQAIDYLDKLGSAKFGTERNPGLAEGLHELEITRVRYFQQFKGGMAFIVEFSVVSSSNPEMGVGTTRSWFIDFKYPDSAIAKVKGFLYAAAGVETSAPEAERAEIDANLKLMVLEATSEGFPESQNNLKGTHIKAESRGKKKDTGNTFVETVFRPATSA